MSGDAYCTASSVKTGRRLSGCSKGGRLRASNKASKVYRERVAFAKEGTCLLHLYWMHTPLGDIFLGKNEASTSLYAIWVSWDWDSECFSISLIFLLISLSLFLVIGLANWSKLSLCRCSCSGRTASFFSSLRTNLALLTFGSPSSGYSASL